MSARPTEPVRLIGRLVAFFALLAALLTPQLARACTGGACVMAGPRLASVSSTQGTLLNTLLGTLTGSTVTVSVVDWNAIAAGDVSLLKTLDALRATLGVSSTQTALNTPITLGQLTGAMSTAASQEGLTSLAVGLGDLQGQLVLPGTITLGSLLTSDGIVGTTRINALSLVSGSVQLFNRQNVLTTPTPITVSGLDLGLLGTIGQAQVWAQAVEAPVYVCGPVGSTFHTAAIRVKLDLQLVTLLPGTGGISIPGLSISNLAIGHLTLYVELARADGLITAVNAIAGTLSAQVTPGVAALYLGTMSDGVFFNRSHAISPTTDLTPGTIGSVILNGTTVGLFAKAAAVGSAPAPTTLTFSGAGVQTRTATTGALFETTLLTTLFINLSLTLSPDLLGGVIDGLLMPVLTLLVDTTLSPVLTLVTSTLVDPLLSLLGIRLGEVDVSSGGTYLECLLSGCVYADPNHNARQDAGEAGTGATLYAKAILPTNPALATAVVAVDPATGNYSFPTLNPATYTVVIGTSASTTVVAPAAPPGWIPTEQPTLSRSVAVVAADVANQRFGLFHGSTLAGAVFKDNGAVGGIANDGLRNGGEGALGGIAMTVTDGGGTTWDTTRSDPAGAYVLWVPFGAGTGTLKVAPAIDAGSVLVSGRAGSSGGTFALATGATSFANIVGTAFTGLDFGAVPINRLDTDGQQSGPAGTTLLFPHVFRAGSAGQLSLSVAAAAAAPPGWSATVWQDTNCNGQLDSGEPAATAPVAVLADAAPCVIVKVFLPETAPPEARTSYVLTASMAYANATLVLQQQRTDLAIVGGSGDGLRLTKAVDKASATSGDVITYTLTYLNEGAAPVTSLKIRDATPAWTVLDSAGCGTRPAGITACSVTAQPAAGAAGSVEWTLAGTLASGASGTVTFVVRVQ